MPPPELYERSAPASVGALVLENLGEEAPTLRHEGPRAEEAHLRAALIEGRITGDTTLERDLAIRLGRMLASRGRDLGTATGTIGPSAGCRRLLFRHGANRGNS